MSEHTPGPWMAIHWRCHAPTTVGIEVGNDFHVIAECSGNGGRFGDDVEDANARLIAAAPELLVALKNIIAEPYGCSLCHSGRIINPAKGHQPDCPYEIAAAVIAKAEGQS